MSDLSGKLAEALHGDMVPKFLATLDSSGKPNVVPIISLDAADHKTLVFGELFIWKTRNNLELNPRVAAAVLTEDLHIWTMQATFRGFVDKGPLVEQMNAKDLFRYNAYVGVRRAAVFDLAKVTGSWHMSKVNVAAELLPVKAYSSIFRRSGPEKLPPRVAEKFARSQALKVLAFQDESGFPSIVPLFSLQPTGSQTMLFGTRLFRKQLRGLKRGCKIAASVITMDPIAYQVKGTYEGTQLTPAGLLGKIHVDEVYSASPPLPGEPIDLQKR
jgi:pyridoxamine 5'-phosphate oxidase-like protein